MKKICLHILLLVSVITTGLALTSCEDDNTAERWYLSGTWQCMQYPEETLCFFMDGPGHGLPTSATTPRPPTPSSTPASTDPLIPPCFRSRRKRQVKVTGHPMIPESSFLPQKSFHNSHRLPVFFPAYKMGELTVTGIIRVLHLDPIIDKTG